jgi:hypothetical protein
MPHRARLHLRAIRLEELDVDAVVSEVVEGRGGGAGGEASVKQIGSRRACRSGRAGEAAVEMEGVL